MLPFCPPKKLCTKKLRCQLFDSIKSPANTVLIFCDDGFFQVPELALVCSLKGVTNMFKFELMAPSFPAGSLGIGVILQ